MRWKVRLREILMRNGCPAESKHREVDGKKTTLTQKVESLASLSRGWAKAGAGSLMARCPRGTDAEGPKSVDPS